MNRRNDFLILLGAAVGGLLGYALFFALARRGLYALALPGGLLGLGAGVGETRSKMIPVVCGFLALALGLLAEWRYEPFAVDASLGYFLSHVHHLQPITLVMIGVGVLIAFYVPFRRGQDVRKAPSFERTPESETKEP